MIWIKLKKLDERAKIPEYKTPGSAGFDFEVLEDMVIFPGETTFIPTGLAVEIPDGYEMRIRPRSGLSATTNLIIPNSPGTIDSDYRGEIGIILYNTGEKFGHYVNYGDRVAQGVIVPVVQVDIEEVNSLNETERDSQGFGSTGI